MAFASAVTDGQTFVFEDSGQGPLVVLFHGFPDSPAGWAQTRDVLNAAGYRTVVPYLRGYHPDTLVPGRGYAADDLGDDAVRLLDALGEESAVLVGHDWGATVVYRAATRSPQRVRGICTIAIPHPNVIRPTPAFLWRARHFVALRLPTGAWLARRDDLAYLDTLMRRWAPRWSGAARDQTLTEAKAIFANAALLDAALEYYREFRPRERAGRVAQPGLVIGGTTDIFPVESFGRCPEEFDAPCDVVVVDGAGHWPHRESPGPVHERLLAFLATLR